MKKIIVFILLVFLMSFNNYTCQKDFKIIESNYYNWFGGIKGVRGKVFVIILEKKSSKNLEIKNLIINGKIFPVEKVLKGNFIEINSRTNAEDETGIVLPIEKNRFYIEYIDLDTKKSKKMNIKTFKYLSKSKKEDKVS